MRSCLACTLLLLLTPSPALSLKAADATQFGIAAYSRQDVDADDLKGVLRDLIRASRLSFQELKAGAGRTEGGKVVYPSSLAVPSASQTMIWVPNGEERDYVMAKVYEGNDSTRAEKIYSDFVAKLKTAFPSGTGVDSSNASPTNRLHVFEPNFDSIDATVVVNFKCRTSSSGCVVTLTVRAPEGAQKEKDVDDVVRDEPRKLDVKAAALGVIEKLAATDYGEVRAEFNNQMKASYTVETLGRLWTAVVQSLGSYQSHEGPRTKLIPGFTVVMVKCRMERGAVDLHISYDEGGKIGGIWTFTPEGAGPRRSAQELESLMRTAQACLDRLIARDYADVGSNFNQQAKFSLPPQKLKEVWELIAQQQGSVIRQWPPEIANRYGYDIVTVRWQMKRGEMFADVTFDDEGKISILLLRPVP
jgi:hypothetical protein